MKGIRHRVLTPCPPGDDAQRFSGFVERDGFSTAVALAKAVSRRAQIRWRIVDELLRHSDHDLVHAWMRQEHGDAALENRTAADRQQLLGRRRAEPDTAPAGSNDRCDVHPL